MFVLETEAATSEWGRLKQLAASYWIHLNSEAVCTRGGGGDTHARYEYMNVASGTVRRASYRSSLPSATGSKYTQVQFVLLKCARIFWQLTKMHHRASCCKGTLKKQQKMRLVCTGRPSSSFSCVLSGFSCRSVSVTVFLFRCVHI